jgi:hypothetical protein
MIVSSCLFAYIIFDAVGDTEGWVNALPLTVVMVSVPFLLLIGWKIYDYYWKPKQTPDNKKRPEDYKEDNVETVENPSLGQRPSVPKRDSEVQMFSRDSFLINNDKNNHSNRKVGIAAEQKENVTLLPAVVENPMINNDNNNNRQARKNWFDEEE